MQVGRGPGRNCQPRHARLLPTRGASIPPCLLHNGFQLAHSVEVASGSSLIWEGFMAAQQPAYLFRNTVNMEACSPEREQLLSTGHYTLVDVRCRSCCTPLGWRYIKASRGEQKYKEGSTLLQQELLTRVNTAPKRRGADGLPHTLDFRNVQPYDSQTSR
ncbi:unnamed protein product [Ostreobium quekettii]|uniref:Yippee domain-containing protein n=1 Tax=Ostreobium quekettii TaxID=121088 RepID=A0A8S1INR1_9CHLO|nr:unnamed protein product [Ostreobium quekettii]